MPAMVSSVSARRDIVEITMDFLVHLQVFQCFFQVVHRVHHEVIARCVDADRIITRLFQRQVREKIHEALEHANTVLCFTMRMPDDRDVLTPDTALIIRIAHLVPARRVAEGKSEVAPFT